MEGMGWAMLVARVDYIIARAVLAVYSKIRNDSGEQYMDGKIILKFNLKKYDLWAGASWFIVRFSRMLPRTCN